MTKPYIGSAREKETERIEDKKKREIFPFLDQILSNESALESYLVNKAEIHNSDNV
jgi:hypothetical protein